MPNWFERNAARCELLDREELLEDLENARYAPYGGETEEETRARLERVAMLEQRAEDMGVKT